MTHIRGVCGYVFKLTTESHKVSRSCSSFNPFSSLCSQSKVYFPFRFQSTVNITLHKHTPVEVTTAPPAAGKLLEITAEFVCLFFLFIIIIDAIKTVRFEMKGIYMYILI